MTRATLRTTTPRIRIAPPVHAVPIGSAQEREHRASSLCPCQPVARYRDLATAAPVYVHEWRAP